MVDQAESLRRLLSRQTRILAVASGKGGVGKTSIAVNLAIQLASEGNSVIMLDADLGMANIEIMFGVRPKHALSEVISGAMQMSRRYSPPPPTACRSSPGSQVWQALPIWDSLSAFD